MIESGLKWNIQYFISISVIVAYYLIVYELLILLIAFQNLVITIVILFLICSNSSPTTTFWCLWSRYDIVSKSLIVLSYWTIDWFVPWLEFHRQVNMIFLTLTNFENSLVNLSHTIQSLLLIRHLIKYNKMSRFQDNYYLWFFPFSPNNIGINEIVEAINIFTLLKTFLYLSEIHVWHIILKICLMFELLKYILKFSHWLNIS